VYKKEEETYFETQEINGSRVEKRICRIMRDVSHIEQALNTPECFLKATRNHWLIENKLHWSLDVIFKEDQSRKRIKNVTENFSIILKTVLKTVSASSGVNLAIIFVTSDPKYFAGTLNVIS